MLDAQMKRGLLENCVLAALARGDSYGYQIIKDMSSFVVITESAVCASFTISQKRAASSWSALPPTGARSPRCMTSSGRD